MMYKLFLIAGLLGNLSTPAWAQVSAPAWSQNTRFELGAKAGAVAFVDDGLAVSGASVGVEVCAWCEGGFALFGEASYWDHFGESASIAGVGLRIQRIGTYCLGLCFVDLGIGTLDHPSVFVGSVRVRRRLATGIAGIGVWIPIGPKLYVRPQLRFYPGAFASAEAGFGWRF